ncbi:hypothetical protein JT358_15055 [Micrococcales bacterium 31B]|nr:hypothetical protein [Micrococcales bacterium 31B]
MEFLLILVAVGAVVCVIAWMNVSKRDKRLRDMNLVAPVQYQSGTPVGVPGRAPTAPGMAPGLPPQQYGGLPGNTPSVDTPVEDLMKQVDALTLQLDDAVKAGQQELDFASAEFGDAAVAPFQAAVQQAQSTAMDAFARRQRLSDLENTMPQLDKGQRKMFARQEIITIGNNVWGALQALGQQTDALQQQRASAQDVPAQVANAGQQLDTAQALVAPAEQALVTLHGTYEAASLSTIATNVTEATARIQAGRTALASAQQTAATGVDAAQAAAKAREAGEAAAQAKTLLQAVLDAPAALQQAKAQLPGALAALADDAAQARAVQSPSQPLAMALAKATQVLATVQPATGDPLGSMGRVNQAMNDLEAALTQTRGAADAQQQAAGAFANASSVAESEIRLARTYIDTRRGGIGPDARMALSEAERTLAQARGLVTGDPAQALQLANQSADFARRAQAAAREDVGRYGDQDSLQGMNLGGMFGARGDWRRSRGPWESNSVMGGVGGALAGLAIGSMLSSSMSSLNGFDGVDVDLPEIPEIDLGNAFDGLGDAFDGIGDMFD